MDTFGGAFQCCLYTRLMERPNLNAPDLVKGLDCKYRDEKKLRDGWTDCICLRTCLLGKQYQKFEITRLTTW